jgi:hypothetical protein
MLTSALVKRTIDEWQTCSFTACPALQAQRVRSAHRLTMTPDITTAGAELAEITFSDFSLAEPIQRAVAQMGYQTPTPVQAA